MKKIIISLIISVLIMLVIPYAAVEIARPDDNASSTEERTPYPTQIGEEV